METSWTPERIKLLDELWAAGLSASVIADKLGNCTRNMVIGKAHRAGLARRAKTPKRGRPATPKVERIVKRLTVNGKHHQVVRVTLQEPIVEIVDSEIPALQRLAFEQLTGDLCKYPVGEVGKPQFFFCGAPIKEGSRYCLPHHQRCHAKARGGQWFFSFSKLF